MLNNFVYRSKHRVYIPTEGTGDDEVALVKCEQSEGSSLVGLSVTSKVTVCSSTSS